MSYYRFAPYVPVARRQANAAAFARKLAKKEKRQLTPIEVTGRQIAASFWGKAWCENLERYSDYANRLPRGRTYARNGSIIDLQISRGKVKALVSGSNVYRVTIDIKTVAAAVWGKLKKDCTRSFDSLVDLLQGRFDQATMGRLSERESGLFPHPKEIKMDCSCPDYAGMCKHIAAVLYGVGARLDHAPELLFMLRDVDHLELITQAVDSGNLDEALAGSTDSSLNVGGTELSEIFGIDLDVGGNAETQEPATGAAHVKPSTRRATGSRKSVPTEKKRRADASARTPAAQRSAASGSAKIKSAPKAGKKRAGALVRGRS